MTRAQGTNSRLVQGFETTFNTLPGTPAGVIMPIMSSTIKSSQNMTDSAIIRGRRDPAPPIRGNIDVAGTVKVPIDPIAFGYWLKLMFGAPTTTGEAAPYKHVFKIGNTMPSAFLEQGFTDIGVYELFTGVMASKCSISFGGDGELSANIDVMGCKETINSTASVASPTEVTLTPFGQFESSIKENDVAIAIVTGCDLQFDFGLDGDTYAIGGQGFRAAIDEGLCTVSGTVTAFFEDKTLLEKAISGTETSIELALTEGTNSLVIKLPEVLYQRNSAEIAGSKGVNISLPFKAYYSNSTDASAVVATLTTSQATY